MSYDRARTTDHYIEEVRAGRMEMADIRPRLEAEGVPDEEIGIVFRLVDNEVLKGVHKQASSTHHRNLLYSGLALCGFGLLVTLGTYFSAFDLKGYTIVAYGPVIGGGMMAFAAWQNLRKG